jgi:DNA-binding response OmpR family regulator/cellulose synthase/poly-beta-1,6-N-acetylglucosamine synthase-like glycosyltransferase
MDPSDDAPHAMLAPLSTGPAVQSPAGRVSVLVVDDEAQIRSLLVLVLRRAGYAATAAESAQEALARLGETHPDLMIADVSMPGMDGLDLLRQMRSTPNTAGIPVLLLTAKQEPADVLEGLRAGADDYLTKPFQVPELLARVQARLERAGPAGGNIPRDPSGLPAFRSLREDLARSLALCERAETPAALAFVELTELPQIREQFGARVDSEIARQIAAHLHDMLLPKDVLARDADGRFALLLPASSAVQACRRLEAIAQRLVRQRFAAAGESFRVTPSVGFALAAPHLRPEIWEDRALAALHHAASHLDLVPARYATAMEPAWQAARAERQQREARQRALSERLRVPLQVLAVNVGALVPPFIAYWLLARFWVDVAPGAYVVVVLGLLFTAYFIWIEGFLALPPIHPPPEPATPYPPASAIIAAYLPNEAATIVETVEAFLRLDYPAPLQIILAYNSPKRLPVEETLREIARRDPRLLPFRVQGSTSKAQNVNAALAVTSGEFVGVFDADHHPDAYAYRRAWRWLSHGYDIVQGHCLVRNGDESWVARLVAVEFEAIYAVSHPGRARLHGFGIFGGSNGYWRTELLRQIRMHGFMLTEDIDSSMRALEAGHRIASDPYLVSRELATTTLETVWNQRMRWAQGWLQVSLKHAWRGLRSPHLSVRNKLGLLHLLLWREVYPWLSIQMFPIIVFWLLYYGPSRVNWYVPVFVLTSLFTLSVGPGQAAFAYALADRQIHQRGAWFFYYLVVGSIVYTPYKNLIAVVAQIKELMRERTWKVTPRASAGAKRA